jgi:hypothetical protein
MSDEIILLASYSKKIAESYGYDEWESFDNPSVVVYATAVWRTMEEVNTKSGDGVYSGRVGKYIRFVPARGVIRLKEDGSTTQ